MKTAIILVTLVASLGVGLAQSDQPQSPHDPLQDLFFPLEIVMVNWEALGMSEQQRETLQSQLEKLRPEFENKQKQLQQQVQMLHALLQNEPVDETEVAANFEKILEREKEIKKLQLGLMLTIRKTLSSEQREKAQKLKKDWPASRQELEKRFRSKVERVQSGVQALVDAGSDPSDIAALMEQFDPLMKQGKHKEADATLDRALKMIEEKK